VAVGDLNGDGKPDLSVVRYGGVSVLLNSGNGTFSSALEYGADVLLSSITMGDLNGDGRPDLVVASYSNDTGSVLLNTCLP
jgi:hypothetical protein